jgi:proliferating cell nuclear antigen
MKFVLNTSSKSDSLTGIIQNLRSFTDTVNIQFTEEGLSIQTMDNSHISVVELSIPAGWFNDYECPESVILGVNINILSKILAAKDKSQILTINHTQDKLEIHFTSILPEIQNIVLEIKDEEKEQQEQPVIEESGKKGKGKGKSKEPKEKKPKEQPKLDSKIYDMHFEIPLVDIESEAIDIPPIDYAAEFSLSSLNFANIVSQLRLFGDTMDIECSEEKIQLYSHGIESGKMSVEINIDELTEFSINEGERLTISFGLNYLNHISAFHKLTKEIELKICDNYPLYAAYNFGEDAKVKFYLAPKISDSD